MKLPKEYITESEIRSIIEATGKGVSGTRNKALLMLMYKGCLRISEALALKPKDIDLDNKTVRILHGKGDKARTVAVGEEAIALLNTWIVTRKPFASNHKPLFCLITKGKEGSPLETSYIRHLVKRLADKAGIDKRVHPHAFRYTGATHLRDRETPLAVIKEQLGHSRISTTDIYLRDVRQADVIDSVNAAWD